MKVVQIPITKADLFLGIFKAYPGTLKCYETLYTGPLRKLACMNDPESEQIYTQTSYFCMCSKQD